MTNLKLLRPNHSNNCRTLDIVLLNNTDISQIQAIKFYFKTGIDVFIFLEDRLKSLKRGQKFIKKSHGDLALENQNKSIYKYFAAHFHQNNFVETDPAKNCEDYPTTQFESYDQCDDHFVKKYLETNFPNDFLPIWATDDLDSVTKLMSLDGKISGLQRRNYGDLIEGIIQSDCPLPCKSTEITTVFVDEKIVGRNESKIDIFFPRAITTSTTDFPKFNLPEFVSAIGGSMGFWLGLGVLQILELVVHMLCEMEMRKRQ